MQYFIIKLVYELKDVVEYPVYKNFIVNKKDGINLAELILSPKYHLEGYRLVGILSPLEISKTTAESLLSLQTEP